jgi:hypothetical protein
MPAVPESTWTPARNDCPHPERWTSFDPQSTEVEVSELVAGFVRALQPDYVVETGTCQAQTARMIGEALKRNGHGHLDTLEVDESLCVAARSTCEGLPVSVHCVPSLEFTPAGPIGFAWFDSLLDLRVAEFERFRPFFVPGAIVGFHDTSPHQGVWGSHVESISRTRCIRLRTPRGVTFVEVLE